MRIAKIINESAAEVKNHISDVIFFQGCFRNCGYCFNKELKDVLGGREMRIEQLTPMLSPLSDVVVITGGEPLLQSVRHLKEWIMVLKLKRKVVLETSFYHKDVFDVCDKVLYTVKTFSIDPYVLNLLNTTFNVIVCVVVGHPWFNYEGFKTLLNTYHNTVYYRYYNDEPTDIEDLKKLAKKHSFEEFNQVWI